jgi:hypothetical protein
VGATPLRLSIRVARQRGRTSARLKRIVLRTHSSGPGLALIRIRARGRVIAQNLEPLFAAGASTVLVPTTAVGERLLRQRPPLRVSVVAQGRDLLAQRAIARARATIRRGTAP